MTCACESCAPASPAPTYTAAWRLECEARLVLSWPLEQRREYLQRVAKRRGEVATIALQDEMTKQFGGMHGKRH